MPKRLHLVAVFCAALFAVLVFTAPSRSDLTGPPNWARIITSPHYDYGPSVMYDQGVYKFWWCGNSEITGRSTDAILYRTYTVATGTWSNNNQSVLYPTPPVGTGDSDSTCDPSVVKGTFNINGSAYTYAMYYTGAYITGSPNSPVYHNSIQAAFSNDGIAWTKYGTVVPEQGQDYGVGQPAAYNYNNTSGIYLFHTVDGNKVAVRQSTNGVTFGNATLVSSLGIDPALDTSPSHFFANADFGYDPGTDKFYTVVPVLGRAGEKDSYGFGFYRLSRANVLAGTGTWETLGYADTNLDGYYLNSSPGFTRDTRGALPTLPALTVYFGGGNKTLMAPDASDALDDLDLTYVRWNPSPKTMPLRRYWNGSDHLSTIGRSPAGYNIDQPVQGYLLMAPASNTTPLWACKAGSDYFISPARNCGLASDPSRLIGLNGFIYINPPTNVSTVPLYSCFTSTTFEYFTSTSNTCEGQSTQGILGQIPTASIP